jgi:hypothetical protein
MMRLPSLTDAADFPMQINTALLLNFIAHHLA